MAFANDTSSFLKLLSYCTALPMIIGFFLVRPIPLPPPDITMATDVDDVREGGMGAEREGLLDQGTGDSQGEVEGSRRQA